MPAVPTTEERFWARIDKDTPSGCWIWTGAINGNGYGSVGRKGKTHGAHRLVYELLVGPIPEGMELDHLCHTNDNSCAGGKTCHHRRCVNPAHLEPVTRRLNWERGRSPHALDARRTHCAQGHEFTPENTRIYPYRSQRVCLACKRIRASETQRRRGKAEWAAYMREYRARKRGEE